MSMKVTRLQILLGLSNKVSNSVGLDKHTDYTFLTISPHDI